MKGTEMGFLQDKKILVTGLLSNRSIAYGIARALAREGAALAFTYQNQDLRSRDVPGLRVTNHTLHLCEMPETVHDEEDGEEHPTTDVKPRPHLPLHLCLQEMVAGRPYETKKRRPAQCRPFVSSETG